MTDHFNPDGLHRGEIERYKDEVAQHIKATTVEAEVDRATYGMRTVGEAPFQTYEAVTLNTITGEVKSMTVNESYVPPKPPRDKEYNPLSIPNLQRQIRAWAIRKGWRNTSHLTRSFGDDMALIASEVSEALEAFRIFGRTHDKWVSYTVEVEHPTIGAVKFKDMTREQLMVLLDCDTEEELDDMIEDLGLDAKPEGVASELADVAIRLFDVCEQYEIDLESEIDYKMKHNDTRAYKHGGKHL